MLYFSLNGWVIEVAKYRNKCHNNPKEFSKQQRNKMVYGMIVQC